MGWQGSGGDTFEIASVDKTLFGNKSYNPQTAYSKELVKTTGKLSSLAYPMPGG